MATQEPEGTTSSRRKANHFAHIYRHYQDFMSRDLDLRDRLLSKAAGLLRESPGDKSTWIAYSAIPKPQRAIEDYPYVLSFQMTCATDNPLGMTA